MADQLDTLRQNIQRWRGKDVDDYWLNVSYIGAAINRMGDHDLTVIDGKLWHLWEGEWREIEQGSDFWLFTVPGTFAWARDMLTKIDISPEEIQLTFNAEFGYVELLRVQRPSRDQHNFTFEVRRFGQGTHPSYEE